MLLVFSCVSSLRISSVPLMTLMRYADADGQDWSPLVAEVMAHMTWSEYAAADDDDDARSKKGAHWCRHVGVPSRFRTLLVKGMYGAH